MSKVTQTVYLVINEKTDGIGEKAALDATFALTESTYDHDKEKMIKEKNKQIAYDGRKVELYEVVITVRKIE